MAITTINRTNCDGPNCSSVHYEKESPEEWLNLVDLTLYNRANLIAINGDNADEQKDFCGSACFRKWIINEIEKARPQPVEEKK